MSGNEWWWQQRPWPAVTKARATAAQYWGGRAPRSDMLVDEHRVLLIDPTDNSFVGIPGPWGGSGEAGRLVYAERVPHSRTGV